MNMGKQDQSATASTAPAWLAGAVGHTLRWALLPAGAIGTIAGVGVATGGVGSTAVMAALADPLSILAARSPGARAAGALTQTKAARSDAPSERVLSNVLTRPLDRFAKPGLGGVAPGAAPGPVGDTVNDAVADAGTPPLPAPLGAFIGTPGGLVVSPGGGGGGGGGSGGGGGGGGDTSTTPTPVATPTTTPVPSVPEPETWFTLLVGFGVVGAAMRTRRRSARKMVGAVAPTPSARD